MENELDYYMKWIEVYCKCVLKVNPIPDNHRAVKMILEIANQAYLQGNRRGLKLMRQDDRKELMYERPRTKLIICIELYKELSERNERLELKLIKEMTRIFKGDNPTGEDKAELVELWTTYNSLLDTPYNIEFKL